MGLYKYSFHQAGYCQVEEYAVEAVRHGRIQCRSTDGISQMYVKAEDVDTRIFHFGKVKGVILSEKDKEKACRMLLEYLEDKMLETLEKLDGYSDLYDVVKKEMEGKEPDDDQQLP